MEWQWKIFRPRAPTLELSALTATSIAQAIGQFYMVALLVLAVAPGQPLGSGYSELAIVVVAFRVALALFSAPLGYVADYLGARTILLAGIVLGASALIVSGLFLSRATLTACAIVLGLANAVYYPANYAILAQHIDPSRLGRAFAILGFCGCVGAAMAPATLPNLAASLGGSTALIATGLAGIATALLMVALTIPDTTHQYRDDQAIGATPTVVPPYGQPLLLRAIPPQVQPLVLLFMLFGLHAASLRVAFKMGATASNPYFAMTALGMLAGGFLADRTTRHRQIVALCLVASAALFLLMALSPISSWLFSRRLSEFSYAFFTSKGLYDQGGVMLIAIMAITGFLFGVITPFCAILVRDAAPRAAIGRAFGFVATGLYSSPFIAAYFLFRVPLFKNNPALLLIASAIVLLPAIALLFESIPLRKAAPPNT